MMKEIKPGRRSDDNINDALYHLRAKIIRERLDGLRHVEALMRLQGIDPEALRVPEKKNWPFRRGGLTAAVLGVLRQGPHTAPQIAAALDHRHSSVCQCLTTLEARGVVKSEGRVWAICMAVASSEKERQHPAVNPA